MAWDFATDPEFERKLEWMRAFVREEVWPIEAVEDRLTQVELDRINAPLQEAVKEQGLWAAHLPPSLGGQGFGQVKLGLMNEILGTSIYAPPVFGCQAPDSGNSEILALAGTPEQKRRWLEPLLAGELRSAFSMTEPATPGSDPTQLATRAVRDGDGYVLDGHKWFTSNGSIADFLIVMAVTDPEAAPHRRASMFIVPVDAPGVTIVRDVPTMEHPQPRFGVLGGHAEILYEGVRLGPDALLGDEGDGFLIAQKRLVPGRIHHCMRWLGMARRAYDAMCERALYRPVKNGLLRDTQTVQAWIADSAAEMQAARLMTLHAAWRIDNEGSSAARTDVSMIKFFGAKVLHDVVDRAVDLHDVVDRAVQIHGALGYSGDMPLEMLYRFARHARFVDGADEVHRELVARHALRAYSVPEGGVPSEHIPTRREAALRKFAGVLAPEPVANGGQPV